MNQPVYIFDMDGVVNSLEQPAVDQRVVSQMAELLNKGHYVAINTGRSYSWIEENVIAGINAQASKDKSDQLFVSAEMGGVTVEFVGGVEQHSRSAFGLPPEQIAKVKQLFDQHTDGRHVHWSDGKVTMATVDIPAGGSVKAFGVNATAFAEILNKELAGQHIKIRVNPDAIDITTPEAGKWAGAQLIHDWLRRTPAAETKHFICLGDNATDYEMARFFGQQGHTVEFVYTGAHEINIEHDAQVTFTRTRRPFNDGANEFLSRVVHSR